MYQTLSVHHLATIHPTTTDEDIPPRGYTVVLHDSPEKHAI